MGIKQGYHEETHQGRNGKYEDRDMISRSFFGGRDLYRGFYCALVYFESGLIKFPE